MNREIEDLFFPYTALVKTFTPEVFREWVRTGQIQFVEEHNLVAVVKYSPAAKAIKVSRVAGQHFSRLGSGNNQFL